MAYAHKWRGYGGKYAEYPTRFEIAQASGLSPAIIARIQRKFDGRVVGVRKAGGGKCREYRQDIVVNGRAEKASGAACQQSDGSWQIGYNYVVQILKSSGRVILVTVNGVTGEVVEVRN